MIAVQALRHHYGGKAVLALESWRAGAGGWLISRVR
jgi:hypothetical protein